MHKVPSRLQQHWTHPVLLWDLHEGAQRKESLLLRLRRMRCLGHDLGEIDKLQSERHTVYLICMHASHNSIFGCL